MKRVREAALAVLAFAAGSSGPAAGEPVLAPLGLYDGRTVVSGTQEPNRSRGLAACLLDVLVKVSGDPSLAADPRAEALAREEPRRLVHARFQDRLEGRPLHDEQGTYDRPHYLTATFDPDAIRRDLMRLGRRPWQDPRPEILAVVSVTGRHGAFRLSDDAAGEEAADMRSALSAAGERYGLPVRLPPRADDTIFARATLRASGPVVLAGSLTWSDRALGWVADWRIAAPGGSARWDVRGVGFDEAFRAGLRGALRSLSTAHRKAIGPDEPRRTP